MVKAKETKKSEIKKTKDTINYSLKSREKIVLVEYKIEGISPLLMHKFSEETYNQPKSQNNNLTPREVAEKYAYRVRDITGNEKDMELYIPGYCIYACLIQAGKFHKLGKKQITNAKTTILPAGCLLVDKHPNKHSGYGMYNSEICGLGTDHFEIDTRSAVNNKTASRIISYRPRLDVWKTSFVVKIDATVFPTSLIDDIVMDAGSKCGLLSFRPLNKGWYGRFMIIGKKEL